MQTDLMIPKILHDGCVLQRGQNTGVWGWCRAGSAVEIAFLNQRYTVFSNGNGCFECMLDCRKTGGPFVLEIKSCEEVFASKVWVGDVFVCAGQSNMELPIQRVREMYPTEPGNPNVHEYTAGAYASFEESKDHEQGVWRACTGKIFEEVSALAYFYGNLLYERERVPIGLINLSKGGTPIQAWSDPMSKFKDIVEEFHKFSKKEFRENFFQTYESDEASWEDRLKRLEGDSLHFRSADERDGANEWREICIPGSFFGQGMEDGPGLYYLKYEVELDRDQASQDAILRLGTIRDADETWINKKMVGSTGYRFPPRIYPVPKEILREGKNEIRIRLVCRNGGAGFTPDKRYDLSFSDQSCIDLSAKWLIRQVVKCEEAPAYQDIHRISGVLFQGMVAPCFPVTVKAVLWYQGEANDHEAYRYEDLLRNMICNWRQRWNQDELPFIIVQLPVCNVDCNAKEWATIRKAQANATKLCGVAVTVNYELGEYNDLHPLNKKDVAYRAFLATRNLVYKEELPSPFVIMGKKNEKIIQ